MPSSNNGHESKCNCGVGEAASDIGHFDGCRLVAAQSTGICSCGKIGEHAHNASPGLFVLKGTTITTPTTIPALIRELREKIEEMKKRHKEGYEYNNVNGLGQYNAALDDTLNLLNQYEK